jgi:hypothetical protein
VIFFTVNEASHIALNIDQNMHLDMLTSLKLLDISLEISLLYAVANGGVG